jgi:DNA-binding XRE family transcriptional regulator
VSPSKDLVHFSNAENVPEALVKILFEADGDDVIEMCLKVAYTFNITLERNRSIFIDAGIMEALVKVFNSPIKDIFYLQMIVGDVILYDENLIERFHELGIPEGSNFFDEA